MLYISTHVQTNDFRGFPVGRIHRLEVCLHPRNNSLSTSQDVDVLIVQEI